MPLKVLQILYLMKQYCSYCSIWVLILLKIKSVIGDNIFKNKLCFHRYLSELLTENAIVTGPDLNILYSNVVSNTVQGLDTTLSFLDEHLQEIFNRLKKINTANWQINFDNYIFRHSGIMDISDIILQMADWIVSDRQLKQVSIK